MSEYKREDIEIWLKAEMHWTVGVVLQ